MDGSQDGALSQGSVAIGFAFVDAAAGKFYVGTINDDCSRAALESLLTQVLYCYCIFILCGRPSHFQLLSGVHHFLLLIDVLLNFGSIVGRLTHSMLLCRLLLKKFCMN